MEVHMRVTTLWLLAASLSCTVPVETLARADAPASAGGFSFELIDDGGRPLPTFFHAGRTYVLGTKGVRYRVRVRNESGRRAEVVVSVDGRDVIDGGPSSLEKNGYIVDSRGEVVIDGYRLSESTVAAFRFGTVSRSYAALEGDARDVGVIGVAVFPERQVRAEPLRDSLSRDSSSREKGARAESIQGAPSPSAPEAKRPGLGTTFGEEHESHVQRVAFLRESTRPAATLTLRYDDRPGLLAAGVDLDRGRCVPPEQRARRDADPFRRDAGYAQPPKGWSPGRS
jgi:hypothetical protein